MKHISFPFRIPKIYRQKEGGFTLVELMVAIAISGMIITVVATMVVQIVAVSAIGDNTVTAAGQVENAFTFVVRDVQMSRSIVDPETYEDSEWLVLEWLWGEDEHRVAYEIEGDRLYRNHTINGSDEERMLVAQYIDEDLCSWEPPDEESEAMKITIVATVGGYQTATEPRIVEVTSRITSVVTGE